MRINKEKFIETYEPYYFDGELLNPDLGLCRLNQTSSAIEGIIEEKLKDGIMDVVAFEWKTGRLKLEEVDNGDIFNKSDYYDGYGRKIGGEVLRNYLCELKKKKIQFDSDCSLKDLYQKVFMGAPKYVGSVYLINIMYFLSKGEIPIYDKFAHKAVKALYWNVSPSEVYVAEAPDRNNVDDVVNVLNEYCRYLEALFGKQNIERKIDRALWVYGHCEKKFEE